MIEIGGVDIAFFNKIILEGIYIEDLHKDTLLYMSKLAIGLTKFDQDHQAIVLDELILSGTVLNIRKYEGQSQLNLQFIIDEFRSGDTTKAGWLVDIETADLQDFRFSYVDDNRDSTNSVMDFKDLQISSFTAMMHDVKLLNDTVWAQIESLSLKEQSGFVVESLSGSIKSSPLALEAKELMLATPLSTVNGQLNFDYTGYGDFQDFIDSIHITSEFKDTKVNLKDLAYFVPALIGLEDSVTINGAIRGTLSKLKGKNIDLTYGTDTRFRGNLSLTGLPYFEETFIRFRVKEFSTSQRDIAKLPVLPFGSGVKWNVPPYVKNLGNFNFIGDFTGFYNDFVAYGKLESGLGKLRSDLSLSFNPSSNSVHYEGLVSSSSFDIGRLLDAQKNIGIAAFDIHITGDGLNKNTAKAELDGIITGVTMKDYYYQNVELKGELEDRRFSGFLAVKDENLDFIFNGEIDYSSSPPVFIFTSDIAGANLDKLNLTTTLESPIFSVRIESNFSGASIDDIQGEIHIRDLKYRDAKLEDNIEFYPIGDISLLATDHEGLRNLKLSSEFADAKVEGIFKMRGLAGALIHSLEDMLPNSAYLIKLANSTKAYKHDQDFEYDIMIKEADKVLPIFTADIDIAPGTHVSGVFNSLDNKFEASLSSKRMRLHSAIFEEIKLDVQLLPIPDSLPGKRPEMELNCLAHFGKVIPSGRWSLSDVGASIHGKTNALQFAASWDNHSLPLNKGSIIGDVKFTQAKVDREIILALQPTEITVADTLWKIAGNNKVRYNSNYLGITGLQVSNSVQVFKIDGSNSTYDNKGIDVVLENFGISAFEPLIGSDNLRLDGVASGAARIYGLFSNLYATGEVNIKNLHLNGELLGDASFGSSWQSGEKKVSLSGSILKGRLEVFSILAAYYLGRPGKDTTSFDSDIRFNKFRLKPFHPFVSNLFADITPSTSVSGGLTLTGTFIKPLLLGKVNVQRGGFRLANLNTDYTFADEVILTEDAISFENTVVNDMKGNRAIASGRIMHTFFRDWSLDVDIEADNIHSLNTDIEFSDLYYGQAYATGDIRIYGPFDNISIDITATPGKQTKLYLPLTSGEDLSEQSYITFINGKALDTATTVEKLQELKIVNFPQIIMNIEVTENAEVLVIFDETAGDLIKASGKGDLQFKVDRDGSFNMYGTYEVRKGDYLFTLSGVLNKRFKMAPGGTITWNGNPYNAILDLNAIYSLKTSLYNLTGVEADRGRVSVECHLKMSGALMNPDITFDIVFPDLDANSSDVAWMFNTEEQINKQVFSLLILGQFQPSGAGEVGLSGGVGENPSELLSNQLSNWLSEISEDFDIGVNYRGGDEITEKELEVALSTQLFNDRLRIDGSVANNASADAQNTSNIVGDFSVEYVLTKQGDISLKAYNRANDSYLSTTAAPYTQGVGVAYTKEFASWRQLFGKMRLPVGRAGKNKNESQIKE